LTAGTASSKKWIDPGQPENSMKAIALGAFGAALLASAASAAPSTRRRSAPPKSPTSTRSVWSATSTDAAGGPAARAMSSAITTMTTTSSAGVRLLWWPRLLRSRMRLLQRTEHRLQLRHPRLVAREAKGRLQSGPFYKRSLPDVGRSTPKCWATSEETKRTNAEGACCARVARTNWYKTGKPEIKGFSSVWSATRVPKGIW
jgi:hypothetical protein